MKKTPPHLIPAADLKHVSAGATRNASGVLTPRVSEDGTGRH